MTFIAIIFSVPLTQRTVLNTDLGADSCGVHIVENGSIEPEEKDYIKICMLMEENNTHCQYSQALFTFRKYMYQYNYYMYVYVPIFTPWT